MQKLYGHPYKTKQKQLERMQRMGTKLFKNWRGCIMKKVKGNESTNTVTKKRKRRTIIKFQVVE